MPAELAINRNEKHPTELTEQSKTTKLVEESNLTIEVVKESDIPAETVVDPILLVLSAGNSELATSHPTDLTEESNVTIELVEESDMPVQMDVEANILNLSVGNANFRIHFFIIATFKQFLSIFILKMIPPSEMMRQ